MKVILENVRSFVGRHVVPLAPLTLVVGENSAGKSTLLAVIDAISDPSTFPDRTSFNNPPFDLGTYETIATKRQGRAEKVNSFAIGFELPLAQGLLNVVATYVNRNGKPSLSTYSLSLGKDSLHIEKDGVQLKSVATFQMPDGQSRTWRLQSEMLKGSRLDLSALWIQFAGARGNLDEAKSSEDLQGIFQKFFTLWQSAAGAWGNVEALAPIRSKPRRTYDPITEEFRPEGEHVPVRLASVLRPDQVSDERKQLTDALRLFGEESGLFEGVRVKNLGSPPSAPFQLQIVTNRRRINLSDVGYGVSQSLPIIAETVLAPPKTSFLLQQPEVHLHPRAQAALGTFLARFTTQHGKQFIVETHSDFLVDRVRLEVARGTLAPEKVRILFLDRRDGKTRVHDLEVDKLGNLSKPPPSYRRFFLDEQRALLLRS